MLNGRSSNARTRCDSGWLLLVEDKRAAGTPDHRKQDEQASQQSAHDRPHERGQSSVGRLLLYGRRRCSDDARAFLLDLLLLAGFARPLEEGLVNTSIGVEHTLEFAQLRFRRRVIQRAGAQSADTLAQVGLPRPHSLVGLPRRRDEASNLVFDRGTSGGQLGIRRDTLWVSCPQLHREAISTVAQPRVFHS